MTNCDLEDNLR